MTSFFHLVSLVAVIIQAQSLLTSSATAATVTINGQASTYSPMASLPASIDETQPVLPNIQDSHAVDAQTACPGYKAQHVTQSPYGFEADLKLAGKPCNVYGTDIEDLHLSVQYQAADRLSVNISPTFIGPANQTQYLIPPYYVGQPTIEQSSESIQFHSHLKLVWTNQPSFGFAVIRKSNGDVLYDTRGKKLVFEDQFVEFASELPENYNLQGLGERIHGLRLGNNFTATIYAADIADPIDENVYGSHPFYLDTRYYVKNAKSGNETLYKDTEHNLEAEYVSHSHGVYFRNAHGQEILLQPTNITWRSLGGVIDLYFYAGPSQAEVTKQYQASAIGYPAMQSYFTFGLHQCRWGYTNWSEVEAVVENYRKFDIPLENIWTDIDYMFQYRNFENDPVRFGYEEGERFLSQLHANGQHYIPIIDSPLYIPNPNNASDAYPTFDRGNNVSAYMLNKDGSLYIGTSWPGFAVYPDWRSQGTQDWWTGEMQMYHEKIPFDGIWIDLSEVTSFCVGSCGSDRITENPVKDVTLPGEPGNMVYDYPEEFNVTNGTAAASASAASSSQAAATSSTATSASNLPSNAYLRTTPTPGVRNEAFPPYVINNANGALPVHAVSPNATHHDGTDEYDIHNLWGHEILNATYNALSHVFPGKRPFVLGRSTFAGSGKYAAHWGGDNYSQWRYMFFSIPQALSFSLFGIPMFGVDTCGFNGNTDEELCARWMQLSAFFPFYRNHNTLSAISQEPYLWASVTDATKTAVNIRYSILPYMYTLFYNAHMSGNTVMRALAWEFPNEPALANADRQFLLGPSLLVTPVLEPQANTVNGVFPGIGKGTMWYDWYNQTAVSARPGENRTIEAPLGHIPLYVRGGSIVPMQQPGYTTAECRKGAWSLLVALDESGCATGQVYLDDGESLESPTRMVHLEASKSQVHAKSSGNYDDGNVLANVTILGLQEAPRTVFLNDQEVADATFDSKKGALYITGLHSITKNGAWTKDWTLKLDE